MRNSISVVRFCTLNRDFTLNRDSLNRDFTVVQWVEVGRAWNCRDSTSNIRQALVANKSDFWPYSRYFMLQGTP